jgi:hypothetical protein
VLIAESAGSRALLRHSVAILAYRCGKAVRSAPAEFAAFQAGPTTRPPLEILAHIGDLLDWALSHVRGKEAWPNHTPLAWDDEVERFFASLKALDEALASDMPLGAPAERILAGPIADALTHTGQLNLLRRLAGSPVRGENYYRANIETGRVGRDQPAAVREFD